MRFFNRRIIILVLMIVVIALVAAIGGVVGYLKSPAFEARVRATVIEEIEKRTGAKVTLNNFSWSLWQRRIRLDDLILRGTEPDDHPPLARFSRIDLGLNFRSLLKRHIDLYELTITQPEFHVMVLPDGTTNFPTPKQQPFGAPSGFEVSVGDFNVMNGAAILNERRIGIDLSLTNLAARLIYHAPREVLEAHLRFDGVVDRAPELRLSIPYTFSGDLDYTRATVLAQRINVTSGRNEVKLQGKISDVLSSSVTGKLEYAGALQVSFLNYFFEADKFAGKADGVGSLEFSIGKFATKGQVKSAAVEYEGWRATNVSADYAYDYPDRRLKLTRLKNLFMSGSVSGEATVEKLPGPSRVNVNVNYADVDAASLTRAYAWDPAYRIFSKATGTLNGWFEGKLQEFDFSGHVDLQSYAPPADAASTRDKPVEGQARTLVAIPIDGSTDYVLQPGIVHVMNADGRFGSTMLRADGVIEGMMSQLKVEMTSSDLQDLAFIYPDANGRGTFNGSTFGAIAKPLLEGEFTLEDYAYKQAKLQHAEGHVRLDLASEQAALRDIRVRQGESELLINGSTALSGSPIDVRIQSNRVTAQDLRPFLDRDIGGVFSGDLRLTGLPPQIKVEGDVKADDLSVDKHFIGDASGHVRFFEPSVEVGQLSIRQGDSTLTASGTFDRMTEAVKFTAHVNSLNLQTFYPLGLPDLVQGVVREADLQGDGTIKQPNVRGTVTLQNVSVKGETFPQVRIGLASTGPKLDVDIDAGPSLNVKGQVDTAATDRPFTASVKFNQYSVQRLANFSQGLITATGAANVAGVLTDSTRIRGDGRIESAEVRVQDTIVRPTQPFTFAFNSKELTLGDVTLTGQATQVTLSGKIGLREPAPLDLKVMGQVDLKLVETKIPDLVSTGALNLQVTVGGTTAVPDLRGNAVLSNASFRKPGFFTGLTNLNGNLSFNQNQIRVDKIDGLAGGGTVHAEGVAVLQDGALQGMNIEIAAKNVRWRGFPEGLRTVIDANVNLRGSLDAPQLEGNIQIQNLAFRSNFEDFLALLKEERLPTGTSTLGRLRLSLHIEGGRNITIQNQLAEVEARVEIDLKGTVDQPAITGRIEASGGTLSFQGNRYTVTRGNIDFVDPLRIQPVIDIEAEAQVRDYRVILAITGRSDNPKLSLRSDPPLPELEIISLIAGGSTREEIAGRTGTGPPPTSEQLFQSGAASILFDLLQQRVGNRLGLLGTSHVRIDPYFVGQQNTSGARITLSEQVTKELAVSYSQDLTANRQQVIQIEYFISRDTSILATRDEFGNFGLDLRHRTRFK